MEASADFSLMMSKRHVRSDGAITKTCATKRGMAGNAGKLEIAALQKWGFLDVW